MTYDASEKLRYSGAPVEGFKFVAGGTTYRYTSADAAVTFPESGTAYTPIYIERGAVEYNYEDTAGSVEITVDRQNPVALLFAIVAPIPPPVITIYRGHRSSLSESIVIFQGAVMGVEFSGQDARLQCAPVTTDLQRAIPTLYFYSQCAWNLYGPGCGVNKASFKVTGTITAIGATTPTITATAFGTKPTNWFRNGYAQSPTGERAFIVANSGNVITLSRSFSALLVGQNVDAYAGCDRTEAVCTGKFNNLVNHLGFPDIPLRNPHDRVAQGRGLRGA